VLLALLNVIPGLGADLFPAVSPWPDPPGAFQAHAQAVARQMTIFNENLARTLPLAQDQPGEGPPPLPAGLPAPPFGQAPASGADPPVGLPQALEQAWNTTAARPESGPPAVASLRSSLPPLRRWIAQAMEQVQGAAGPTSGTDVQPAPPAAMATQLAALGGLADAMGATADGYLDHAVSPAQAAAVFSLASTTLSAITNSLRVAIQAQFLQTYGAPLVPIELSQDSADGTAGAPGAATRKACCQYADYLAQAGIQQLQGTSAATNMMGYLMALPAAAQRLGFDLETAPDAYAPILGVLAGTDAVTTVFAALGAKVLVPQPGAVPPSWFPGPGIVLDPAVWGNSNQALASRCAAARCNLPVTQARMGIARQNLAAAIMNLVANALFAVAEQLSLAVGPSPDPSQALPGPRLDRPMAWAGPLLRQVQRQAQGVLPERVLAGLPGPSAAEAAAFAGVTPGTADPEALPAVLQVLSRNIQDQYWPTLADLDTGSALPASRLAGMLSSLYRLAATGLESRPAAGGPASAYQPEWQFYGNLTALARYAVATMDGYGADGLDRRAAHVLLDGIVDAFRAMLLGWALEGAVTTVEVAGLYLEGIVEPLTRVRAQALGLGPRPGREAPECLATCEQYRGRFRSAADAIAINATQASLAAYIEAAVGSGVSEVLAIIDLAQASAADGNSTASAANAHGRRLLQAGPPLPAQTREPLTQSALAALYRDTTTPAPNGPGPTPAPSPAAACPPGACELTFPRQLVALAQQTRNAADLTLLAYSLNLMVVGLRTALVAEAGD
jgi:hypothetical protein